MFNKLTIKTRLFALIGFMAVTMISLSTLSLYALNKTNQGLQTVYFDRTIPLADLGEIKFNLLHIRTALVTQFSFPDDIANQQNKIEEDLTNINRLWDGYIVTFLMPEEKVLAEKFINERQHFMEELKKVIELQNSTKKEEAKDFYFGNVRAAFTPLIKTSDDLIKLQMDVAKQEYARAQAGYQSFLITSIVLLFAGLSLSILLGVFIIRHLMDELGAEPNEVAGLITQVAQGKLDNVITLRPTDTNSVLANIRKMQHSINDFVSAQDTMAKKHAEGWIFEEMDAKRFPGIFGRMANEINILVATHVAVKMQVVKVVSKYANGDFSVDMERLPGDKAKVTAAIESVKTALLAVSGEIKTIVAAGVNGDFSRRVDANR
jgi:CHASE3 domain sensor protein